MPRLPDEDLALIADLLVMGSASRSQPLETAANWILPGG
jgi:hypothetical protein